MLARRTVAVFAISFVVQFLSGCTLTDIESKHSLLREEGGAAPKVYFIRPETERRYGFPDNNITVELNQEKLLSLGKGEYTMVSLVPRDYVVTLKNLSEVGPHWKVKEISRQYRFEFAESKTYYLVVQDVDGEFRGIHYVAELVDEFDARQIAKRLRAVGPAKSAKL